MKSPGKNTGVLLANLGSPDSYEVGDVKKYLRQFLMDERVIDMQVLLRAILVKGIIVPLRSPKSAAKYKTIWTGHGSPLIRISNEVRTMLQRKMDIPVALCMRYGNPTPEAAFEKLLQTNPDLTDVVLVPLYPHYAMSSYETAVAQVRRIYQQRKYPFSLKVTGPFYNHPGYIQALANSVKPYLGKPFDHILFSYHGIPERHVRTTDITKSHYVGNDNCGYVRSDGNSTSYLHPVE